ncbi:MAG: hypothetical protein ABR521_01690 [Gaiellaceae bacterium]
MKLIARSTSPASAGRTRSSSSCPRRSRGLDSHPLELVRADGLLDLLVQHLDGYQPRVLRRRGDWVDLLPQRLGVDARERPRRSSLARVVGEDCALGGHRCDLVEPPLERPQHVVAPTTSTTHRDGGNRMASLSLNAALSYSAVRMPGQLDVRPLLGQTGSLA